MRILITTALCLCFGLIGCGPRSVEQEPIEQEQPTSRFIGQITSVHASQSFVLIRRSPGVNVAMGTILISEGVGGTAANLRVSGESLGQMIAADIQSGSPAVGDSVREPQIEEVDLEAESAESGS